MVLLLKILGGIAALALGVHLGMGQNRQTADDIDQVLGKGRRRKAKRHFMWLNYLRADRRASERRAQRRYFRTATARRDEEDSGGSS